MSRNVWGSIAALLLFGLVGCGRDANLVQARLYLCGCSRCERFVKQAGPKRLADYSITFAGSPGDALAFKEKYAPFSQVSADPDESRARSEGLSACPSAVLASGTKRIVLGNGADLNPQTVEAAVSRLKGRAG